MGKQLPFISVVIPAYNEEKYLPKCLKALQQQTYPKDRYQVIVVDNNSIDKTPLLAKKYGAKVITEKQQGHVYSLNTGLQNATGDIYAVTDADSIPAKDWLEKIAEIFNDASIVGVTGSVNLDFKSETVNYLLKKLHHVVCDVHFSVNKPLLAGPNMAIRSSAFKKKLKSVDTRYKIDGDVEIGMRLRKHGRVVFHKRLLVTSSSRRFKKGINIKDLYQFTNAYIYTTWFEKPPRGRLIPVR